MTLTRATPAGAKSGVYTLCVILEDLKVGTRTRLLLPPHRLQLQGLICELDQLVVVTLQNAQQARVLGHTDTELEFLERAFESTRATELNLVIRRIVSGIDAVDGACLNT